MRENYRIEFHLSEYQLPFHVYTITYILLTEMIGRSNSTAHICKNYCACYLERPIIFTGSIGLPGSDTILYDQTV